MSKNTNLSFLTDYITADITNGRIGINNASPTVAFDVSGATKISGALTLTSTISNGTYTYTLPSATGTLALTSALSGYLPLTGGTLTGALFGTTASFSGVITSTIGNNSTILNSATATTGWVQIAMNNTTGSALLGVEGSTAGTLATDSLAYASVLRNYTNTALQFGTNNIVRATITSTGNVGIGTTSPSAKLTVVGASANTYIAIDNAASGENYFAANAFHAFQTAGVERMRITSAGNVGIGTSAPSTFLHVVGPNTSNRGQLCIQSNDTNNAAAITFYYSTTKVGNIGSSSSDIGIESVNDTGFYTGGAERMRIPSTGGILVGQSSKWNAGVDNSFRTTGASSWTLNANSLNTGSPYLLLITTGRSNSSDLLINCETNHASLGGSATTARFKVDGGGIIYATNTTVQSISDIRTKENIIDAESGLNIINNLKVRRFDFKDGFGDNKKNQLGFIAQEIETVFPEAVGLMPKTSDTQNNDIQYKTVGPAALIPILTKAIQELSAKVSLLENK